MGQWPGPNQYRRRTWRRRQFIISQWVDHTYQGGRRFSFRRSLLLYFRRITMFTTRRSVRAKGVGAWATRQWQNELTNGPSTPR